jgi:hypothetical protein
MFEKPTEYKNNFPLILLRGRKKINRVSHDCHGSVGSPSLNIAVPDNRQGSPLEVRGLKYLSLITATVKQALPTKPGSHGLVDLFFSIAQAFFFCSTLRI